MSDNGVFINRKQCNSSYYTSSLMVLVMPSFRVTSAFIYTLCLMLRHKNSWLCAVSTSVW